MVQILESTFSSLGTYREVDTCIPSRTSNKGWRIWYRYYQKKREQRERKYEGRNEARDGSSGQNWRKEVKEKEGVNEETTRKE